jgi:hypothetical protein
MPKVTIMHGEYSHLFNRETVDADMMVTEVGGWSIIETYIATYDDATAKKQEHASEVWKLVGELLKQALHLDPVLRSTVRNQISSALAATDDECHTGCAPNTERMAEAVVKLLLGDG